MRYQFNIVHVPGKNLITADALSRAPAEVSSVADSALEQEVDAFVAGVTDGLPATDQRLQEILTAQQDDPICTTISEIYCSVVGPPPDRLSAALKSYWPHRSDFSSTPDGLLLFGQRIVIPAALRLQVLDQINTGHQGITKCQQRARQSVWWPGISAYLQAHVENCQTCAWQRMQPVEPLITSAMPDLPWQKVAADFVEYDRKTYLLVVDRYSRFIEIALMTTMTTAQTVRHMQSMFARHGFPETLISDNGPQFSSAEFAAFATKHKIHHVTSSPLYPQDNGMAERAVQTVKRLLHSSDPYDALLA